MLRVHVFEPFFAAPLPVLYQIGEELAGPAGAAFEKAEAEVGEASGDAAKKQRLSDRMTSGGEMADMIEGEVARRVAETLAAAAGVEGRGDLELQAFLPDQVV